MFCCVATRLVSYYWIISAPQHCQWPENQFMVKTMVIMNIGDSHYGVRIVNVQPDLSSLVS